MWPPIWVISRSRQLYYKCPQWPGSRSNGIRNGSAVPVFGGMKITPHEIITRCARRGEWAMQMPVYYIINNLRATSLLNYAPHNVQGDDKSAYARWYEGSRTKRPSEFKSPDLRHCDRPVGFLASSLMNATGPCRFWGHLNNCVCRHPSADSRRVRCVP